MLEKIKSKILSNSNSYNYYKINYEILSHKYSAQQEKITLLKKILSDNKNGKKQNNKNQKHHNQYKKSRFYQLESKRICGHSNSVNWELDDKIKAYKFVDKYDIKHPKLLAKLPDIKSLKEYLENNKLEKFVLKISNQHSAAGVFLLRKISEDLYFDDLTSKAYTINEIVDKENKLDTQAEYVLRDTYFFIEESVTNFVDEFKIPFDYKIFCFNGVPKLILQMNRNVDPVNISFFDGNFIPLVEGRDWFLNHEKASTGIPIIPPSAFQMLYLTKMIALDANKKHVRIDWFDNGEYPVFGEFTFASGGSHSGLFSYSDEILANIDKSIENENYDDYDSKGYNINTRELIKHANTKLNYNNREYMELLTKSTFGKRNAIRNMILFIKKQTNMEKDPHKAKLYQHLKICWEEVLLLYDETTTENIIRHINYKNGFITKKTKNYEYRLNRAKNALWRNAQFNTWFKLRFSQFILEFGGNKEQIQQSKEWIKQYSNENIPYACELKKIYKL